MAFIGKIPAAAPLTSSDVADGIITNAKLAQDIISADTALAATPADTDELLVSDAGVLKRMDYSHIKAANTPAFFATAGTTTQTISNTTFTKMIFGTEILDTNSAFASSVFTVPAGEGGLYCFYNNIRMPLDDGEEAVTLINVDPDGSSAAIVHATGTQNYPGADNTPFYHNASTIINLDAGDICFLSMYVTSGETRTTTASYCYFGGFKIIT